MMTRQPRHATLQVAFLVAMLLFCFTGRMYADDSNDEKSQASGDDEANQSQDDAAFGKKDRNQPGIDEHTPTLGGDYQESIVETKPPADYDTPGAGSDESNLPDVNQNDFTTLDYYQVDPVLSVETTYQPAADELDSAEPSAVSHVPGSGSDESNMPAVYQNDFTTVDYDRHTVSDPNQSALSEFSPIGGDGGSTHAVSGEPTAVSYNQNTSNPAPGVVNTNPEPAVTDPPEQDTFAPSQLDTEQSQPPTSRPSTAETSRFTIEGVVDEIAISLEYAHRLFQELKKQEKEGGSVKKSIKLRDQQRSAKNFYDVWWKNMADFNEKRALRWKPTDPLPAPEEKMMAAFYNDLFKVQSFLPDFKLSYSQKRMATFEARYDLYWHICTAIEATAFKYNSKVYWSTQLAAAKAALKELTKLIRKYKHRADPYNEADGGVTPKLAGRIASSIRKMKKALLKLPSANSMLPKNASLPATHKQCWSHFPDCWGGFKDNYGWLAFGAFLLMMGYTEIKHWLPPGEEEEMPEEGDITTMESIEATDWLDDVFSLQRIVVILITAFIFAVILFLIWWVYLYLPGRSTEKTKSNSKSRKWKKLKQEITEWFQEKKFAQTLRMKLKKKEKDLEEGGGQSEQSEAPQSKQAGTKQKSARSQPKTKTPSSLAATTSTAERAQGGGGSKLRKEITGPEGPIPQATAHNKKKSITKRLSRLITPKSKTGQTMSLSPSPKPTGSKIVPTATPRK